MVRRSRLLSVLLSVLTVLGTGGTWHPAGDDPDCATVLVVHDHAFHQRRVAAPAASRPLTHCAICHWLQSFRIDGARRAPVAFSVEIFVRFTPAPYVSPVSPAIVSLTPRAPPLA